MSCAIRPCRGREAVDTPLGLACRAHAVDLADRLARRLVLRRDRGRCRRCGEQDRGVRWAHILGRRVAPSLRHDPDNALALCVACHRELTVEPARFVDFVEGVEPGLYDSLVRRQAEADRAGGGPGLAETIRRLTVRIEKEAA